MVIQPPTTGTRYALGPFTHDKIRVSCFKTARAPHRIACLVLSFFFSFLFSRLYVISFFFLCLSLSLSRPSFSLHRLHTIITETVSSSRSHPAAMHTRCLVLWMRLAHSTARPHPDLTNEPASERISCESYARVSENENVLRTC